MEFDNLVSQASNLCQEVIETCATTTEGIHCQARLIEIDACDPNEVCRQRLPTCSEENPAMMPASWVVKISPVAKISNQSVF